MRAPVGLSSGFGVLGGLVFALICLAVIGLVAHHGVLRLRADAAWVVHTREVIGSLAVAYSDVTEVENAVRSFVITGDDSYAREAPAEIAEVGELVTRLRKLTLDNPEQQRRAETLGELMNAQFAFERRLLDVRRDSGLGSAQALLAAQEGKQLHERLRVAVEDMRRAEEALLNERQVRATRGAIVADVVIVSGSLLAFSCVGLALVVVRRDYLGRAQAEAKIAVAYDELAREKARLEFIFEAAPVGVSYAFTDMSGRCTRLVNDAHLQICALSREDFDRPEAFVRITHPDDRAEQARLAADLAARKIDRYAIDKRYVRADGQVIWVMLSFERRHHRDGSYEDLSVVVDITKRKRAEAELENFFEVSLDFLTIAGPDGFFKRVNPIVTETLGWSVKEFLSQPYLELIHPDDREATMREVERQIVRGEKVLQFENRYRHKDGSWRTLSWRSVPHLGGLMYGAARDVTESRRAELEIRRLNADLRERAAQVEASNKELEAFSYSVSHDLRAPLRHISGYIAMLARDDAPRLSEKGRRCVDTIYAAAREMGELIDNLLSFSKIGRIDMRQTSVDLSAIVADVRHDLELVAGDRQVEWQVAALPSVRGDWSMLKQVFANLLENALKYTRPRNPALIEVGCAGEQNGRVVVFVRDNGVGFDMQYADKLFGVFQRLHRADEFEGTGVGLANVQRIILRHGGRVWAEAKPDQGATFFVTLERIENRDDRLEPSL